MTLGRLLLRNLLYHWRGNLAVLLGVVVGSAVLTGALLVGDSLRGSLRDLALRQLGWVEHALVAGRFVREELAGELQAEHVCPALLLQGAASSGDEKDPFSVHRAGRVVILGVDERFWPNAEPPLGRAFWRPTDPADFRTSGVVLNAALARELEVKIGDEVTLSFQKASELPRESLLGKRQASEVLDSLKLTVRAILADDSPGARFNLNPSPEAPRNAFVPLAVLQARLGLPRRVNALLASGPRESLQAQLRQRLTLDDWNLVLRGPDDRAGTLIRYLDPRNRDGVLRRAAWQGKVPDELAKRADAEGRLQREDITAYYRERHPYLSLESRQAVLEDAVAAAALPAAREVGLTAAPTLVYLAHTISDGTGSIWYAIVAALDPTLPPPLGPFLPPGVERLDDEGIILADWPRSPLRAKVGTPIHLDYYQVKDQGRLERATATLMLRGRVPLQGAADDPFLTPEYRGITDKLDKANWENPTFPYEPERITAADKAYWERYRTTPQAYVTLAKGQELWKSRFGKLTSVRLAPTAGGDLGQAGQEFRKRLRERLDPEAAGLVFDAVRARSLEAANRGVDFGELFLYFSFFLIVAALLLVGLLFRLNLERRAAEVGVLFASGYRHSTVRWLLLAEGALIAAIGALAGVGVAVLYAQVLLKLLRLLWPGGLDKSILRFNAAWSSFLIGYAAALAVSVLTIAWAVRLMGRVPPRVLLAGTTSEENEPTTMRRGTRWSVGIAAGSIIGALALAVGGALVRDSEWRAGTFFGSGALLLTAALAAVWASMRRGSHRPVGGHGMPALGRLGVRNAARHPARSLLTAGLLAAAAFLLVAVESFRRHAGHDYISRHSGSGSFALLAETDVPVYQDLNGDKGQAELDNGLTLRLQSSLTPEQLEQAQQVLHGVTFYPFRLRAGDDASCLNLYQPRRPRLLGVPAALIRRGGFRFADSLASTPEEKENPWLLLRRPRPDGAVPVVGEANTVTWVLKRKLGETFEVPGEKGAGGEPLRLCVVGLLKDSVFQSGLLMAEERFVEVFPGQEGYNFFLIDTADEPPDEAKKWLQIALADRGVEVTPSARRLESYLAVENAYLSTFQVLGGLGLLLGTLGLAVVLLRGVWERRGELALLRALGYRHGALGWLVLAENAFLLALGLGAGTLAALLAVAPHLLGDQGEVSWAALLGMLGVVLGVGLIAGTAAVLTTLRAPLLPALRRE
jgi:ABC-type lipoprotein release transport system permease subunit